MKMVKKILFGLSVIAIAASLTGCIKDDTESAIKGTGKKYSVNYTNDGKSNYRAYKASGLKHAGGLVKVTFDNDGTPAESKMGVIFGLEERTENKKKLRNFNIIGVSATGNYYVSTLTDIEDIQAENFGASTTATTGPREKEWVKLQSGATLSTDSATGNKFIYVWYQAKKEGKYDWALLSMTDDVAATWNATTGAIPTGATTLKSGTITGAFTAVDADNKVPQQKISVYAMIQPGKTLAGKWNIVGTYLEAEDAE